MSKIRDTKLFYVMLSIYLEVDEILKVTDCKDISNYLNNKTAKRASVGIVAELKECITKLSDYSKNLIPLNVGSCKATRNTLVHDYAGMNFANVWNFTIAQRKQLKKEIKAAIETLEEVSDEIFDSGVKTVKTNLLQNKERPKD